MTTFDLTKRLATLRARAALLGLQLQELPGGRVSLNHAGAEEPTVPSLQAAEAAVYAAEAQRAEILAQLRSAC